MTPNDLSIPNAAGFYRERGFRPIPMHGVTPDGRCRCGGRLPTGKDCNAGKHALDDAEPWKDGREYYPNDFELTDNIAIALGPWGGPGWLVCLDVDGPAPLESFFGPLPETLTQKSPRGMHYFFTVPAYEPLGNWVDCTESKHRTGTGLDVRYARGKINVAPSRSAFGRYLWQGWRAPAELPGWVCDQIYRERRRRGLPVDRRWERGGKRP